MRGCSWIKRAELEVMSGETAAACEVRTLAALDLCILKQLKLMCSLVSSLRGILCYSCGNLDNSWTTGSQDSSRSVQPSRCTCVLLLFFIYFIFLSWKVEFCKIKTDFRVGLFLLQVLGVNQSVNSAWKIEININIPPPRKKSCVLFPPYWLHIWSKGCEWTAKQLCEEAGEVSVSILRTWRRKRAGDGRVSASAY